VKGLLVSLLTLVLYGLSSAVIAQLFRPKRFITMFAAVAVAWSVGYFVLYAVLPANLYFLPPTWMCSIQWFDMLYGFIVFLLNCHTLVDCFSGSCGGLSTALLVAILQAGDQPVTTEALVAKFKLGENSDRIYGWRLPRLEKQGYVRQDPPSGRYLLTAKGRILAVITFCLKRIMNLGAGG
jgi:hypothetical protein